MSETTHRCSCITQERHTGHVCLLVTDERRKNRKEERKKEASLGFHPQADIRLTWDDSFKFIIERVRPGLHCKFPSWKPHYARPFWYTRLTTKTGCSTERPAAPAKQSLCSPKWYPAVCYCYWWEIKQEVVDGASQMWLRTIISWWESTSFFVWNITDSCSPYIYILMTSGCKTLLQTISKKCVTSRSHYVLVEVEVDGGGS